MIFQICVFQNHFRIESTVIEWHAACPVRVETGERDHVHSELAKVSVQLATPGEACPVGNGPRGFTKDLQANNVKKYFQKS